MLRPCYLNQKQEEMFHRYCNSSATSLCNVYNTWSDKKEEAYRYCLRDMKEHGGQDMRITGAMASRSRARTALYVMMGHISCIILAATDSNSSIWRNGNDEQRD